jgi:hypothetical protein
VSAAGAAQKQIRLALWGLNDLLKLKLKSFAQPGLPEVQFGSNIYGGNYGTFQQIDSISAVSATCEIGPGILGFGLDIPFCILF